MSRSVLPARASPPGGNSSGFRWTSVTGASHTHTHIYFLANVHPPLGAHWKVRVSFCLRGHQHIPIRSITWYLAERAGHEMFGYLLLQISDLYKYICVFNIHTHTLRRQPKYFWLSKWNITWNSSLYENKAMSLVKHHQFRSVDAVANVKALMLIKRALFNVVWIALK